MTAAILPIRGIETERKPHLNVVVRDVEPARHHANDRSPNAVDLNLAADDVAAAAERGLPQLAADDDDRRALRKRLLF